MTATQDHGDATIMVHCVALQVTWQVLPTTGTTAITSSPVTTSMYTTASTTGDVVTSTGSVGTSTGPVATTGTVERDNVEEGESSDSMILWLIIGSSIAGACLCAFFVMLVVFLTKR